MGEINELAGVATVKSKYGTNEFVFITESYWNKLLYSLEKSEYRVLFYIISRMRYKKEVSGLKIKKCYLAEHVNISPAGAIYALRGLMDKGFIKEVNGVYYLSNPPTEDDNDDDAGFEIV